MNGIFGFFDMLDNYEDRKIARYEDGDILVSTAKITDSAHYTLETAIRHPFYNDGQHIIVETYNTVEDAKVGHERWVKVIQGELPESLTDVSNIPITELADIFNPSGDGWRVYKRIDG
jgi:hypothetical protein